MGIHPSEYWEITFAELIDFIDAFNERREMHLKDEDCLNHALGNYIRIAIHNQKKYPKEPFSAKKSNKQTYTSDEARMKSVRAKYGEQNGDDR